MAEEARSHQQYAEGRVHLAYGLGADGRLKHISEVERGLACGCRCPACNAPLIAKLPRTIAQHFSHAAETTCATGPETAVHYLAKEALETHLRMLVPAVGASRGGLSEVVYVAREMKFDGASLELRLDGVTPDIIVTHAGRELIVEIYVTHKCGEEKIAKLKEMNLAAIEIDLSDLPRTANREEIARAVIEKAPREWLHNAKIGAAEKRLIDRLTAVAEEKQRRLDQEADEFLDSFDALMKKAFYDATKVAGDITHIEELGFRDFAAFVPANARIFNAEPKVWQSVLFRHIVIVAAKHERRFERVLVSSAMALLKKCNIVNSLFEKELRVELRERIGVKRPGFMTPREVVHAYYCFLEEKGVLQVDEGSFWLTNKARRLIEERQRFHTAALERATRLERGIARIIANLSPEDKAAFDLQHWLSEVHEGYDGSPLALSVSGGEEWLRLESSLSAIEAAFTKDQRPESLLDLPIGPAIELAAAQRAHQRELARIAEVAREEERRNTRESVLEGELRYILGVDANVWLDAVPSDSTETRRALSRESDENVARLLRAAQLEGQKRNQEKIRKVRSRQALTEFSEKVSQRYGAATAEILLRNYHPKLGGRPIEILKDPGKLQRCLDVILQNSSRSRR